MSSLQGHLPPIRKKPVYDPSPPRKPPLTQQSDWTRRELLSQRLFERHLFLRTTHFKIVSRMVRGGPAELLRMIFNYGRMRYETQILSDVDWKALLMKTPNGNLPVLWIDHNVYGEPNAIVRHLASHLGLLGTCEPERIVVEAVLAQVEEIRDSQFIQLAFEELSENRIDDSAELLFEVMIPRNFGFWQKQIESTTGPYLLGTGISVADMAIYDFLVQHINHLPLEPELKKFRTLEALYKLVPIHPQIQQPTSKDDQ